MNKKKSIFIGDDDAIIIIHGDMDAEIDLANKTDEEICDEYSDYDYMYLIDFLELMRNYLDNQNLTGVGANGVWIVDIAQLCRELSFRCDFLYTLIIPLLSDWVVIEEVVHSLGICHQVGKEENWSEFFLHYL